MILATRGVDRETFRLASPEFMAAARFALFAERAAPFLAEDEAIVAQPLSRDLTPDSRIALAKAKLEAEKRIPIVRALLYPEDE